MIEWEGGVCLRQALIQAKRDHEERSSRQACEQGHLHDLLPALPDRYLAQLEQRDLQADEHCAHNAANHSNYDSTGQLIYWNGVFLRHDTELECCCI